MQATRARVEAMAHNLGRYPRISAEMGDRILNCPEGIIEGMWDAGPPDGFTVEGFVEFMNLYTAFRYALNGIVANEIGYPVANNLINSLHTDYPTVR